MTSADQIENNRLSKAGQIPEATLEYLDAKKGAERKETWCGRNWVRMLIYFLPYTAAMILMPKLQIGRGYKFCILVGCFGFCQIFYGRAFSCAVLRRLEAESRAQAD
jgi:hypothetical protein